MNVIDSVLGPRVPETERDTHGERYRRPKLLFSAAALLLVLSAFFPYWRLDLWAPQFPQGLRIHAYLNRLQGDVDQLEGLNHYVGMKSFAHGAVFERSIAFASIAVFAGLLLAGLYIHSRWVTLFVLPAVVFPLVFVADLQWWLWRYGHELDPSAPFAGAVGEFTPRVFGSGDIAQFHTKAYPGIGLLLAVAVAVLVGVGLWFHRAAYRPLVDVAHSGADGLDG